MRHIVCLAIASIFSPLALAQNFNNIRAVQEGTRMIVTYDLVSGNANATFTIALYSSHNNFASSVSAVSGDIGKGQKPGVNKRVEWEMRTDLQSFRGQISVELAGIPEPLRLEFKQPFLSRKVKQGKPVVISWEGGSNHANVKLDVYREGKLIAALGEKKNTGSFQWAVPPDVEKGTNFTLRISAGGEQVDSTPFDIKAPLPLWAKLAPVAVGVGVVTYIIFFNKLAEAPEP